VAKLQAPDCPCDPPAQTYFNLWLICAGCPRSSRSGRAAPVHKPPSPRPGPLSIKLFVPYCDAICDSPAGTRQFERVTS